MVKYMIKILEVTQVTDEIVAAFERLVPQLSSSNRAPSTEQISEMVESPATIVFIARDEEAGNEIVGTLTLAMFRIPTGLRAWIEDVVVDTQVRGKGIGKALTLAAVERARQAGATTVDLTSRPSRVAANQLYQGVGFVKRETNVYRYSCKK
jgi:ribosomal protein S18 acetylase RimI-like enzyme